VLDQFSKFLVIRFMTLHQSLPLWTNVIHLTYVTNTGAAFSLFQDGTIVLRWLSLFASLGLIALGLWAKNLQKWEKIGYGLILAGAMGNGIDRFVYGYVIDFIELKFIRFPVFNIADVCINLGLCCLLFLVWTERKR
jgi:signal peptidase II